MDPVQTRDEPAAQVRSRLEQLGVHDDLRNLAGWQRVFVYDALEVAHKRHIADHDGSLAGARYLQELADVRASFDKHDPLAAILRRAPPRWSTHERPGRSSGRRRLRSRRDTGPPVCRHHRSVRPVGHTDTGRPVRRIMAAGCVHPVADQAAPHPAAALPRQQAIPVGQSAAWSDETAGLYGTFRVLMTSAAQVAADYAAQGIISGLKHRVRG